MLAQCMDGLVNEQMYTWMDARVDKLVDEWIGGWLVRWMVG